MLDLIEEESSTNDQNNNKKKPTNGEKIDNDIETSVSVKRKLDPKV